MMGTSQFQTPHEAAEPFFAIQSVGPVPVGMLIGIAGGIVTLLLMKNRTFPAGLLIVLGGMALGLILGKHEGLRSLRLGIHFPEILPLGIPGGGDFAFALPILVLPQLPMTLGNAVIAYADLSGEYFGEASRKVTCRGACITMALSNVVSFLLGGMPLCHGAGGLAAHYQFGARTAGSNLMIGSIFLVLAIFLGMGFLSILYLIPISVLGVLLVFAGGQLALTIIDLRDRKDLFVALFILGVTLASNLAAGFITGIIVAYILKSERVSV